MLSVNLSCFWIVFSGIGGEIKFLSKVWHLLSPVKNLFSLDQCIKDSVTCLAQHTCTFLPFPSLLFLLFPKPSDKLCCIQGASVDQSPLRIKQRTACNPRGYKQGLSLTETRFSAAFSAVYQTWFKGSFWFHKETLSALPPSSSEGGGGEIRLSLAERKGRTAFLKLWRES